MHIRPPPSFTCFCKNQFNPKEDENFKNHLLLCRAFQEYSPITQFFNGLKMDRLPLDDLFIIKCELELKLQEVQTYIEIQGKIYFFFITKEKDDNQMFGENNNSRNDLIPCSKCSGMKEMSEIVFLESCVHSFCKKCLVEQVRTCIKQKREVCCLSCGETISEFEKRVKIFKMFLSGLR